VTTLPCVLHVRVLTGAGGGPERSILGSTPYAAGRYRLAAAYLHPPGDAGFAVVQRRAAALGGEIVDVPDRGPCDPRPIRRLLRWCRSEHVRLWHGHDYKSNLLGLLLRRWHPMALVTTMHGWSELSTRTRLYFMLDRRCIRRFDHVIAVSADLSRSAARLGIAAPQCSLLPNGVDTAVYARRRSPQQSPLRRGLPAQRVVIGAAGRLSAEKRFDDLIRAVAPLVSEGLDVELWIAGEGPARRGLQRLARATACAGRVTLLGFVEDTVAFYEALDLFVSSSEREGLPNVVLEALSMEVPTVATRAGSVDTVITDGDNGLLCEPRDVLGLTNAIRRVLHDRSVRERLAAAGRHTIQTRFSFAQRAARELAIYDRLLSSAQR